MRNKKGFTLIELLAVIVILGLLMAIAIPSVTKYINQSRKKSVVVSIDSYIGAITNSVNSGDYNFYDSNVIYAVPIDCIALEKGGNNPLGEWHHANEDYWAYVLVQYNVNSSSYTYGYTFKDSSGHGMYPTAHSFINQNTDLIVNNINLSRPITGLYSNMAPSDKWSGFVINEDTKLLVLNTASEGNSGNGKSYCTLMQKTDKYEEIVEKNKDDIVNIMYGDVNLDGEVTMEDADLVNAYTQGTGSFTQQALKNGDINGDGQISIVDYMLIKRFVLGTYTGLPFKPGA